jgi:hypothetical protein
MEEKMSNEPKLVRKAARCIQYLFEAEGKTVSSKQIMDMIKDKDLSDVAGLKTSVENDMRDQAANKTDAPVKAPKAPSRKQHLEVFMTSNWNLLKDNEVVRTALVNAYCQGRVSKDRRKELSESLLARCAGEEIPVVETPAETPVVETPATDAQAQLAADLMGDEQTFDF